MDWSVSENRRRNHGYLRRTSTRPTTPASSIQSVTVGVRACISGPPSPWMATLGTSERSSAMRLAPWRSPLRSPATRKQVMRGGGRIR